MRQSGSVGKIAQVFLLATFCVDKFPFVASLSRIRHSSQHFYVYVCELLHAVAYQPSFLTFSGGGSTPKRNWVDVFGPLPKTLNQFMAKVCDFPYPIYYLAKNLIPYL